jgi:hypothetical protein
MRGPFYQDAGTAGFSAMDISDASFTGTRFVDFDAFGIYGPGNLSFRDFTA